MERLTKLQIFDETVAFYSEDVKRRSIFGNYTCCYFSKNGNKCAFSRCFLPEFRPDNIEGSGAQALFENGIISDENLQEQYRGHDKFFWNEIQNFHDVSLFWNADGLSEEGKERVVVLREKYAE